MKKQSLKQTGLVLAAALCGATAAQAHVSLEQAQVPAGASYKAVLRVTHGCEGTATHTVVVRVPAGFRGAKPMPKPGWTLSVQRAPLAQPYESHGRQVSDDVVQVTWKADSRQAWLADAHFDEFVLRGQAPAHPGPLWWPVQQLCEKGEWNWSETPASGTSTRGLKAPAALLQVMPAASPTSATPHH
jgi:periplasmic copper chaperone A